MTNPSKQSDLAGFHCPKCGADCFDRGYLNEHRRKCSVKETDTVAPTRRRRAPVAHGEGVSSEVFNGARQDDPADPSSGAMIGKAANEVAGTRGDEASLFRQDAAFSATCPRCEFSGYVSANKMVEHLKDKHHVDTRALFPATVAGHTDDERNGPTNDTGLSEPTASDREAVRYAATMEGGNARGGGRSDGAEDDANPRTTRGPAAADGSLTQAGNKHPRSLNATFNPYGDVPFTEYGCLIRPCEHEADSAQAAYQHIYDAHGVVVDARGGIDEVRLVQAPGVGTYRQSAFYGPNGCLETPVLWHGGLVQQCRPFQLNIFFPEASTTHIVTVAGSALPAYNPAYDIATLVPLRALTKVGCQPGTRFSDSGWWEIAARVVDPVSYSGKVVVPQHVPSLPTTQENGLPTSTSDAVSNVAQTRPIVGPEVSINAARRTNGNNKITWSPASHTPRTADQQTQDETTAQWAMQQAALDVEFHQRALHDAIERYHVAERQAGLASTLVPPTTVARPPAEVRTSDGVAMVQHTNPQDSGASRSTTLLQPSDGIRRGVDGTVLGSTQRSIAEADQRTNDASFVPDGRTVLQEPGDVPDEQTKTVARQSLDEFRKGLNSLIHPDAMLPAKSALRRSGRRQVAATQDPTPAAARTGVFQTGSSSLDDVLEILNQARSEEVAIGKADALAMLQTLSNEVDPILRLRGETIEIVEHDEEMQSTVGGVQTAATGPLPEHDPDDGLRPDSVEQAGSTKGKQKSTEAAAKVRRKKQ
ncbi:hypothetical protein LTR15_006645 [Elasticomyces elasticus]|nr:hypothetical protein LTR15_006645 [Elasticomyces elasticus]